MACYGWGKNGYWSHWIRLVHLEPFGDSSSAAPNQTLVCVSTHPQRLICKINTQLAERHSNPKPNKAESLPHPKVVDSFTWLFTVSYRWMDLWVSTHHIRRKSNPQYTLSLCDWIVICSMCLHRRSSHTCAPSPGSDTLFPNIVDYGQCTTQTPPPSESPGILKKWQQTSFSLSLLQGHSLFPGLQIKSAITWDMHYYTHWQKGYLGKWS